MLIAKYKSKKDLSDSVGKDLKYEETSQFGTEYQSTGTFTVQLKDSKTTAEVTMESDVIKEVK